MDSSSFNSPGVCSSSSHRIREFNSPGGLYRQSRTRSLLPPSLTLAQFPSPSSPDASTPALSHILSLLLPTSVTVPLSLELLNESAFVPESKNEDLHSGVLQVSDGTTLLITESGVREGKLVERGAHDLLLHCCLIYLDGPLA